jgi:hypothetical protein
MNSKDRFAHNEEVSLTIKRACINTQSLKILREQRRLSVERKILCQLHKSFGVVKEGTWKSKTASNEWNETRSVGAERILIMSQEPWPENSRMLWDEAKLLTNSDRNPHLLAMPSSQRAESRMDVVGVIVESTKPDLQTAANVVVLKADDGKSGLNTEQMLEERRVRNQDTPRDSKLEDSRARNWLVG